MQSCSGGYLSVRVDVVVEDLNSSEEVVSDEEVFERVNVVVDLDRRTVEEGGRIKEACFGDLTVRQAAGSSGSCEPDARPRGFVAAHVNITCVVARVVHVIISPALHDVNVKVNALHAAPPYWLRGGTRHDCVNSPVVRMDDQTQHLADDRRVYCCPSFVANGSPLVGLGWSHLHSPFPLVGSVHQTNRRAVVVG